ncbi:bifunctional 2-polyprenyl-6-hydroxyphenol methylase/3-demethylubiquinol 3-O-methyltransferase UbiG [Synechococcus sp. PCC 7336]|uniref:class I SAM-dependent methyltransferase n=1 Tax=Synechococcus sp. PCC 7336 TaxID=195250 RepID=UPI000684F54F|nr:class I SAM-dependent methyltransferase [Synechococcus sp. PCC 7336]
MVATESPVESEMPRVRGRARVVFNWLPAKVDRLLDAGCAFGDTTAAFARKCNYACGFDLMAEDVEKAKQNYPNLEFFQGNLEHAPFDSASFDVVVFSDVIEHVYDEVACLNELYRVLKPGGLLILTTPHRGMFGFMDPLNSGRALSYVGKKYFSPIYRSLYRLRKGHPAPTDKPQNPFANDREMHRHYSLADLQQLLDRSSFGHHYEIEEVSRWGLVLEPLVFSLEYYADLFGLPEGLQRIVRPLGALVDLEQRIRFGTAAYNIGLKIRKSNH